MPIPHISLPGTRDALKLCEEAGFVSRFLKDDRKRKLVVPEVGEPKCEDLRDYIAGISAAIALFRARGEIPNELLEKIKDLIPKYFGKQSDLDVATVISLAILQWLQDRGAVYAGVKYYPLPNPT